MEVNKESLASRNIALSDDGKYRWVYGMNLFRNPSVFFLVWKIFFFIILGIFALTVIIDAAEWSDYFPLRFLETMKVFAFFIIGMTVLSGFSYLIYAAIMHGKYTVEFEMDEKGILHKQIESQAKKAKKIGAATAAVGAATVKTGMIGAGINSQRTEMYSDFSKVKKVKAYRRRNLIKVNGPFSHNQVYAAKEDFDFIYSFISSHCQQKKK